MSAKAERVAEALEALREARAQLTDEERTWLDALGPEQLRALREMNGAGVDVRFVLCAQDVERDTTTGFPTLTLTRPGGPPRPFKLTPAAARKVAGLLVAAADEHDAEMEAAKDARLVSVVERF